MKRFLLAPFALLLLAGTGAQALPVIPLEYHGHDVNTITLTFTPLPGEAIYRLYRTPLLFPRREVKIRPYIELFAPANSPIAYFTDAFPIQLSPGGTRRQTCYFLQAFDAATGERTDYFAALGQRLCFDALEAEIAVSTPNLCATEPIQFNAQTTGLWTGLTWTMGDGAEYQEESVEHTYPGAGTYPVALTATGPFGPAHAAREVIVRPLPQPGITGPEEACERATLATEEGMSDYQWQLDGEPLDGAGAPTLEVTREGEYTVAYTDSGCRGVSEVFIFKLFTPPFASFDVEGEPRVGEFLNLRNTCTGSNLTYLWDFGDGHTSTEESPAHYYKNPGPYTIILEAADGCGRRSTTSDTVQILPGSFSIFPGRGSCGGGTTVTLTGNAFPPEPIVRVGDAPAPVLAADSDTLIIRTPAHPGGPADHAVQVFDAAGTLIQELPHAFRFATLAFAALPEGNAVATVDLDLLESFAWPGGTGAVAHHLPVEIESPEVLLLVDAVLYIGGQGGIIRVSTGDGLETAVHALDPATRVTALAYGPGPAGPLIWAAVHDPTAQPQGRILLLEPETLALAATAEFDGGDQGMGLDFAATAQRVHLLARGPLSEDDRKEHKKAMILNEYDPLAGFEPGPEGPVLPLLASKNRAPGATGEVSAARMALTADGIRLFLPDAPNGRIAEYRTDTGAFHGPDIITAAAPAALAVLARDGGPRLAAAMAATHRVDLYDLPENGPKPAAGTLPSDAAGCLGPVRLIPTAIGTALLCRDSGSLLFYEPEARALVGAYAFPPGEHPVDLAIHSCEEVE